MNAHQDPDNENLIHVSDLSVIINKHLILSDISFTLKKGEMIYIIGKTGSGKSTLLKTIYGEIKPSGGEIVVNGFDLKKIKQKQVVKLRRQLGMVFQDFQLLTDRTVTENLLFVMKATGWKNKVEMYRHCQELLSQVNLSDKGSLMPHHLSGGEQQRVCIARAMINNPSIILADEPTGNLDPETAYDVLNVLFALKKTGISILMVTHNYRLIEKFPAKTYQFREGKISLLLEDSEIQ